ncbi:Scarecrow-like protein 9 [Apostasia shenzhenica]|uniref:Scarecrow-like protein 9 n=1 Tax=Apostasia shenzhenica TaxID=1088818 RepID=A0A2I0B615_9ASPA|nr:Scarecrow-like protein 9 [Apostasia shenzhenica]
MRSHGIELVDLFHVMVTREVISCHDSRIEEGKGFRFILGLMLKNSMNDVTIEDFEYSSYLSMDDFLVQEEELRANPILGDPETFEEQQIFAEPQISSSQSQEVDSQDSSEFLSDLVLEFIDQMLMEEEMGDKFDTLLSHPDLEATEKPFYEIIGEKYPPSPDRPPLYSSPSPDSSDFHRSNSDYGRGADGCAGISSLADSGDAIPEIADHQLQSQIYSSDAAGLLDGLEGPSDELTDLFFRTIPASQFEKGFEEAMKFLPSEDRLIIGVDLPQEPNRSLDSIEVKEEDGRGIRQKSRHDDGFDLEEQRSRKQSAVSHEEPDFPSEMFDRVFLCTAEKFPKVISDIRETMNSKAGKNSESTEPKEPPGNGRKPRRKKQPKKEVVDLHSLLMQCAQTVAAGDHRRGYEILRQIRQHSSPHGDACQRLAHYFANGLEARLAGTGSEIFHSLTSMRKTAADVLKAYQLYLAASPFKKVSYHFSNQTILETIEKATRVHILDFGIYFGFQWPIFFKMLSSRPGGPPKIRITGIDVPQPGFRPAERIEETGRRLADYAERFGVPFEYHSLASKLEQVKVEDLRLDEEEMLVVNCVFRLTSLGDESMGVDCPRDKFLRNIRKLNPAVFVNIISNGNYGAPFFLTRFREALYHFSAMFDMLEMTVPREEEQRMLVERDICGRAAINVISCEGPERVERPESYKQVQVRCLRAGLEQLPISHEFTEKARGAVKAHYHKDFSLDEDGRWLLQGWRGRIFVALSAWKPRGF